MSRSLYRFGACRIDLSARELHGADGLATLSPKVFDVLAYLIEHRDRAVGRDELIAAVWGRVDVSDTLLGQTVLKARRAIGDAGKEQNAIRTIPRFGYRWIAAVDIEDAATVTDPVPAIAPAEIIQSTAAPAQPTETAPVVTPAPVQPRRWLPVAAALVLIVAGTLWYRDKGHNDSAVTTANVTTIDAAAVLPVDVSNPGEWSWLRLGLMDLIATRMRNAGVAVVPSDNIVALLRSGDAIDAAATVADSTGARTIVTPSAAKAGNGWLVRLELHAADGVTHTVEANDADVIAAGRTAVDRLLALLGKRAPDDAVALRDLPAAELISRAEAALLTDDLAGARRLLDSAPMEVQRSPELRLRQAQIEFRAAELDAARSHLDALLAEVSAEADPVMRARVLNGIGVVDIRTEHHVDAERVFGEAIGLLDSRDQPAALGQAYTGRAVSHAAQGQYDQALADFSRARIALELAGDMLALARVEANEGIVSAKRGRHAEALVAYQRATQRFERFGALNELALTLASQSETELALLQPVDALATTERAWPLIGRIENRDTRHTLQIRRAAALAANGRLTEARSLLSRLVGDMATKQLPMPLAYVRSAQASLEFDAGDFDAAAALAGQAISGFDNPDYLRERAMAWLLLTRALHAQGNDADAATEVERLRQWAKDQSEPPLPVYAALADAERAWARRERDTSHQAYDAALAVAEKAAVPFDTAEVVISYGTRLIADGELDRASAVVGQVARWADRDFGCALLQVRYYRALGEEDAWQSALQRARGLAGERVIPAALARLPGADAEPVAHLP